MIFLHGGTSGRCSCLDCRRRHSWPLCLFLLNLCNFWFYSIFGNVFVQNCLEKCCKEALEGMLRAEPSINAPTVTRSKILHLQFMVILTCDPLASVHFHTSNMARATIEPIFWALGPRATKIQISRSAYPGHRAANLGQSNLHLSLLAIIAAKHFGTNCSTWSLVCLAGRVL